MIESSVSRDDSPPHPEGPSGHEGPNDHDHEGPNDSPEDANRSPIEGSLNNSNVSGLAAGTADTLTAEGWNVAETGNFSADQFAQTAVYYGTSAGEEQAAQTIATQLGVPAEPKPTSLESTAGVVVIVTQ